MTETVTILRLEDTTGLGAFQATPWGTQQRWERLLGIDDYNEERPTPWLDGLTSDQIDLSDTWNCGCTDESQLQHWFPDPVLPDLEQHGVEFTRWEVPAEAAIILPHQVVFDRDRANCIERKPIAAWRPTAIAA